MTRKRCFGRLNLKIVGGVLMILTKNYSWGADFSTDGKWCYLVMWVVSQSSSVKVDWEILENRLASVCPPFLSFYFDQPLRCTSAPVYLLKAFCIDKRGHLHGKYRCNYFSDLC